MAVTPNNPNLDQKVEDLQTQVSNLQNLVNALQNQQTNPSTSLPQVSSSSKTTSIPTVSQVVILAQNPMPTSVQVTVGFAAPSGILANQIDHYNVWFQTGSAGQNISPTVIVATKKSPCTFSIPSINGSVPGVIGVQTVMRDGQILAFNLCPTTALTVALANTYTNQNTGVVALTAGTPANIGNSITVATAGTYLFWLSINVNSTATANITFSLNKNGGAVGTNLVSSVANNTVTYQNIYQLPLAAGDVLQPVASASVTGNYVFNIQTVLQKQFVS